MDSKNCMRCGVSSNNAYFEYIFNANGTPKSYRSRCYQCRHPGQIVPQNINNILPVVTEYNYEEAYEEALKSINKESIITDICNEEYCWYTGRLLDKKIDSNSKNILVCNELHWLKGDISDRDFDKIINYLKIFSKRKQRRRVQPFKRLTIDSQEYLRKLADESDLSLEEINELRNNQADCCYLSNILMIWTPGKWNCGTISNNKLVIPFFSKLQKRMTDEAIKELLNDIITHDKCSELDTTK